MVSLKSQLILEQDNSTELGSVVFDVEPILLAFDDSMAPAHTNIVDPDLALVSSSELEFVLFGSHCEKMDVPRRVLV